MKTKPLLIFLVPFFLSACASGTSSLTPEQIAAYGQLLHQSVHDGIQDYKTIKTIH